VKTCKVGKGGRCHLNIQMVGGGDKIVYIFFINWYFVYCFLPDKKVLSV